MATILEIGVPVDNEDLLTGYLVAKEHEARYAAGSTVPLLISPDGKIYALVSQDTGRTTDEAVLPEGWLVVDHTFTEDYASRLPNPTLNIRTGNEDSYQGPLTDIDVES